MFNIKITYKKLDEFAGEYTATVTFNDQWVASQTSKHGIVAERSEAFDKILSWANGFVDGVNAARNNLQVKIDANAMVQMARDGVA